MSTEKCFCHLTDRVSGETYVVKDALARAEIVSLQNKTGKLQLDISGYSEDIYQIQQNINAFAQKSANFETRITTLESTATTHNNKLAEHDTTLGSHSMSITSLNSAQGFLRTDIDALKTRIAALESTWQDGFVPNAKAYIVNIMLHEHDDHVEGNTVGLAEGVYIHCAPDVYTLPIIPITIGQHSIDDDASSFHNWHGMLFAKIEIYPDVQNQHELLDIIDGWYVSNGGDSGDMNDKFPWTSMYWTSTVTKSLV